MTTTRTKTTAARKSAKKTTSKAPASRKRGKSKVVVSDQTLAHDDDPVRFDFRGVAYDLERTPEGYTFGGQTFKSLAGFGKHLAALHGEEPAESPQPDAAPAPAAKVRRKPKEPAPRDPRLPAVGTVMKRSFKGHDLEVKVTTEGFEYEGETYRSVSALARHITGYSISGPVFFRLVEPKAATSQDGQ